MSEFASEYVANGEAKTNPIIFDGVCFCFEIITRRKLRVFALLFQKRLK